MVIQTLETGGGYTLGFRVDPASRLVDVYKELDSLFSVYSATPIFGVTYERKEVGTRRAKFERVFSHSNNHLWLRRRRNETMTQFQSIKLPKLMTQKAMKSIRNFQRTWLMARKTVDDHRFSAKSLALPWKKSKMDSH